MMENREKFTIISEHLNRLDNIKQWSEKNVFFTETVSAHSYKVTFFTAMLIHEMFHNFKQDDEFLLKFRCDCLNKALLHDWDEAIILRDLSHELKYNTYNGDKLRVLIDDYVSHVMNEDYKELGELREFLCVQFVLDSNVFLGFVNNMVKIADWLAMYYFLEREFNMGNKNLLGCNKTVIDGLQNSVKKLLSIEWFEMFSVDEFGKLDFNFFISLIDNRKDFYKLPTK